MTHKLLNLFRNLIITLVLVGMVIISVLTTSSYAASYTLGGVMRQTISVWYLYILRISITIYVTAYLIIILKLLVDKTPERIKILKQSIFHFFIMFIVIYFLHYIMIAIISVNEEGLNIAKAVGKSFSGIDMENDEYDLYETVLSKAYEVASVPGFIGLLMYLLLVYYTYKFAFFYLKRYINIIILILLAPIIFVISTIKKILTGISSGAIGKWFKEFIFNVIIQTFHAIFYAMLIGLTLRMSDNDENLIGALLTLIIFGFIFKIDEFIRKIFNFVGGSTKINSSRTFGKAIDTAGGAVSGGLNSIGGAAATFGNNLENHGLKGGLQQTASDAGGFFKNRIHEAGQNIKALPMNISQKAITAGVNTKDKAVSAFARAKEEAKDYNNILNGERVKANLTTDELIAAQHDLSESEGLIGLRNKVQSAGKSVSKKVGKAGNFVGERLEKVYATVDGRTKLAISNVQEQMKHDVDMLENNVEMAKRVYRVVKKLFKRKKMKLIKNSTGMNVDVTNTMMLVVDAKVSPEEFMADIREQLGEGTDIGVYVFENIGAQTFLSPAVGSPRMGMAVLAEEKYEEIADHRIEEVVTRKKRKKRKIKKASIRISKKEMRKASKSIKKNKEIARKTYKFSRFNADTAKKITRKMLQKSRAQNKYIVVINKAYDDIQINNMRVRGVIGKTATKITHEVRAKRKNVVRTVRKIKLLQKQAIEKYRSVEKQTRRIEVANQVACQFMNAKNVVKLGFKQIDQMTPGQIGLRKMIKEGKAKELSGGLIAVRNTATVKEKVRATGIVKAEDKNLVLQFVVGQSGEFFRQIVDTNGKIVQPAVDKKGKVVQSVVNLEEQVIQPIANRRKQAEPKVHATGKVEQVQETTEEQTVQQVVTFDGKVVEQVINSDGTIDAGSYKIVHDGGEKLVVQVQTMITNEDVGLAETATVEERTQKLETLLEDIKREADTQPLLEQVLEQATPEERELDEILVSAMEEAEISSVTELKQYMHLDEAASSDKEFIKKSNRFEKAITEKMIETGVITPVEAEDEDIMQKAFQILDTRVETLTSSDGDILLDTAAEMERTQIAEELISKGKFTPEQLPTDEDIDAKMGDLSKLLSGLAKNYVEQTIKYPRAVLNDTVKYATEVIDNAYEGVKTKEELAFEEAFEEAEKRWAKKHGKDADKTIVEQYKKKEKGEDDEKKATVKITLNFFGAVLMQGQAVTLSNRHSIKDFYDKVNKLEGANLNKTQERFLQLYGEKLEKMQLMPFSFAKNPVEDMDEWCIYVVTDNEDISQGEKEKDKEEIKEDIQTKNLVDLYYIDIKRIFTEFIVDREITSFEQLYKNIDANRELTRRLRIFLFRQDEKDENIKAKAIVNYLRFDVRFKNIMQETEIEILAKTEGESRREKAKSTVKVMSKSKAEKVAANRVTKEEAKKVKEETKNSFMRQVLSEVEAQETEEARETQNEELRQLLQELDDNKAYISLDQGNVAQRRQTLKFETNRGE